MRRPRRNPVEKRFKRTIYKADT